MELSARRLHFWIIAIFIVTLSESSNLPERRKSHISASSQDIKESITSAPRPNRVKFQSTKYYLEDYLDWQLRAVDVIQHMALNFIDMNRDQGNQNGLLSYGNVRVEIDEQINADREKQFLKELPPAELLPSTVKLFLPRLRAFFALTLLTFQNFVALQNCKTVFEQFDGTAAERVKEIGKTLVTIESQLRDAFEYYVLKPIGKEAPHLRSISQQFYDAQLMYMNDLCVGASRTARKLRYDVPLNIRFHRPASPLSGPNDAPAFQPINETVLPNTNTGSSWPDRVQGLVGPVRPAPERPLTVSRSSSVATGRANSTGPGRYRSELMKDNSSGKKRPSPDLSTAPSLARSFSAIKKIKIQPVTPTPRLVIPQFVVGIVVMPKLHPFLLAPLAFLELHFQTITLALNGPRQRIAGSLDKFLQFVHVYTVRAKDRLQLAVTTTDADFADSDGTVHESLKILYGQQKHLRIVLKFVRVLRKYVQDVAHNVANIRAKASGDLANELSHVESRVLALVDQSDALTDRLRRAAAAADGGYADVQSFERRVAYMDALAKRFDAVAANLNLMLPMQFGRWNPHPQIVTTDVSEDKN